MRIPVRAVRDSKSMNSHREEYSVGIAMLWSRCRHHRPIVVITRHAAITFMNATMAGFAIVPNTYAEYMFSLVLICCNTKQIVTKHQT